MATNFVQGPKKSQFSGTSKPYIDVSMDKLFHSTAHPAFVADEWCSFQQKQHQHVSFFT
jgi:hypothetical protein